MPCVVPQQDTISTKTPAHNPDKMQCVCVLLQVGSSEGADRTFERVHVHQPLEVPSAHTIRRLAAFDGERQRPQYLTVVGGQWPQWVVVV